MEFSEYRNCDATTLAKLISSGQVSANELLDVAISRSDQINPSINALHTSMHDFARLRAKQVDTQQPFAGVPFLLKDVQHALKGYAMSSGTAACQDFIPLENASVVDRYLDSGLIPFAKTTSPEFALLGVTESKAYGATRNPWNLQHTPGGSSGGSAAAVAAGIVPIASANDGGGSIRIPASHCGLIGLKPSRGRVPVGPYYGEVWMGASTDLALTRTVRDTAAILDAIHGPDIGAAFDIKPPSMSYSEFISQPAEKLKIAFSVESPIGTEVDQSCIDAVYGTVKLLKDMGHIVEECRPDYNGLALIQDFRMLYFANVAATVRALRKQYGNQVVKKLEVFTRTLAILGELVSAGEYYQSRQNWNTYGRVMGEFHSRYDLYLTPSVAMPPIKIGEQAPNRLELFALSLTNHLGLGKLLLKSSLLEKMARDNLRPIPFSQLANLTGQPAISLPLFWTDENLPIGVQFIAAFGREDRLLRLAAQLEEAKPWFERVADI